jgi:hypothetical protein
MIAAALAGGDDFKRRVLYWFFAFVTIMKYVFAADLPLCVCFCYLRIVRSSLAHSCVTSTSIRFRFLITFLILLTFAMFLFSEWWQVHLRATALSSSLTRCKWQIVILVGVVPIIMLYVV